MAEDLVEKLKKIERTADAITNNKITPLDLINRALNVVYGVWWVGTLRAEDQEDFVKRINEKPKLNGQKRNWKAKNLTLLEATIFGTIGTIEHYLEARVSAPVGLAPQVLFYGWMAYGAGLSLFRAIYSFGENGKPIASYSPRGVVTNGVNYLIKKHRERRTQKACGGI